MESALDVVVVVRVLLHWEMFVFVQLRAQQDEERKELNDLRNKIKGQLQLDKEVS